MPVPPAPRPVGHTATNLDHRSSTVAEGAARGEGKREYVQQMFADIAPRYDLLNHVLSLNIDKAWRRRALRALGWTSRPTGTYLDLCAGTLDVGATLTRQLGFAGFVVGADFAVPMLQYGVGKASRDVLSPVGADALALPFADATLDGGIVAFGIRNVANLDVALREARRVIKPGGRFVILEFSTPRSAVIRTLYHAYFHHVLPRVGRVQINPRPQVRRRPPEDGEVVRVARQAVLAVEVLSPSDTHEDVTAKVDQYLAVGVPLVWIVDPHFRTVTVHRPGQQPDFFTTDDDLTAEPHLPGFQIAVRRFFE